MAAMMSAYFLIEDIPVKNLDEWHRLQGTHPAPWRQVQDFKLARRIVAEEDVCVGWLERDLQEEFRHWDGNDVLLLRDAKDGHYLYSTYQNAQMYLMAVYKSIPNDNPMRIIQIFADIELIQDR